MAEKSHHHLPPLSTLFRDSWEMFKGSLLKLFILNLIGIGIFLLLGIVTLLIGLPLGVFSIFNAIQGNALSPAFFASLGGIGVVLGIAVILGVILTYMLQAASILVVAGYKKKVSYSAILKQSLKLVWPLFLLGIVSGFIIIGGYFLLIIPGIVFAIFLSFAHYEVILENKKVLPAIRRSIGIVKTNFWGILGRGLLLGIIIYAIILIPQLLIGSIGSEELSRMYSFVGVIIQILISWYTIAYSLTLYNQAKEASPEGKHGKIIWPLILSVIGWVVGIILMVAVISAVGAFMSQVMSAQQQNPEIFEQLQDPALKEAIENPTEENMRALLELFPTDSPERAELERQINEQFGESGETMLDVSPGMERVN